MIARLAVSSRCSRLLRRFAAVFIAVGTAMTGAAPAARADQSVKLMLDYVVQGTHAPFFLAKQKGYFKAEGIDVSIDAGKGGTNTAVNTAGGVYQFGYVDLVTMINFNAINPANPLICVYMAFDETPLAVITPKSTGIRTPKDLDGRKLGGAPGGAGHDTISILLKAGKAESIKITWVNVAIPLMGPMLAKGEIEGIGGFTNSQIPMAMSVGFKREDLVVMKYSDFGVDLYGLGIVTTKKYATEHPDVVRGMIKAINRGMVEVIRDPAAGLALMKSADPMFRVDLEAVRLDLALGHTYTDNVKKNGSSSVTAARVQSTIDAVAMAYNLAKPPKVEEVWTDAFLPPQADRMVGK